ncbi:MAG TPA: PD-(D/E)XK nuclease family protein [Thermoleophilaceae bacterium]|nr:PD-(D/E)XK nuclease family protein [Thermoleophilaceae bacterium]
MPLTLVTGPANAAKAGSVLGSFRARLDEEPLLVVPRMDDIDHHQRELAGGGALIGGHVVRFAWLFEEIAQRCGYSARRASRLQTELIAEQAAKRASLVALAASAERPGFAKAALRLFADLERSRVEPGRFAAALKRWAPEGPQAAYATEVASLYRAYRERLKAAGLVDTELFAWQALERLRHEPHRWGRTPVFVYGFDQFTELQLEALEVLAQRAEADVVVSLPYERGRVAFKPLATTFEQLRAIAGDRVEELPALDDHYAGESRGALHALERGLFVDGAPEATDAAPVHLLAAGGARAEIELIAAEVLALLRSGTRPGDVAVVFRDPKRYAALASHVFDAYAIPYSVDRRVRLGHTALGRGLLALIRCARPSGTAADLLAYLRTPGRLRKPELADRLEAHVRRAGIRRAAEAAQAFEQLAGWPLDEVGRLRAAAADGKALPGALLAVAEARFADPYRRAAHVLRGSELDDARVFDAIRSALKEVAVVARPDLFALHELLSDVEVRTGDGPDPARVQIASPETIRARRFEAVFAAGLQEGEWPAPAGADPFLSDDDRREIAEHGGLRLPFREDQLDRERYLFYATISRAERLLYLSWRVSDEDGNPEARSFFVEDVRDVFGDSLPQPRFRDLAAVTWAREDAPTETEWQRAVALESPRVMPRLATRIATPALATWLGERGGFSAGMLEAFTECPVRWLVERVLDPAVLEPDPQHLVRGSYAHRVLELTYRRLREQAGSARVTPSTLPTAEGLLHEALRELQHEFQLSPSETRVRAAVRRLEFDLLRFLGHEAQSESPLEPTELELSFGLKDSPLPALRLEPEGIEIRGVIDRVDRSNGHALVVDYKSGKNVMGVAKWAEKGKLQAPLYALVAKDLMGLEPIGAVYQPLAGDDLRPRGVVDSDHKDELGGDRYYRTDWKSPDDLQAALDEARETVRNVVARMRDGEIQPKPNCCSGGTGCAFPSICRNESA